MSEMDFETQIISIAKEMDYPRTPDIAGRVMTRLRPMTKPRFISRRLAWSLITILVIFSSLFLIPPVRAAIIEFIQIGVVRIFKPETSPPPAPIEEFPVTMIPMTATPAKTAQPLIPLLAHAIGKTTLEDAAGRVNFPILLPTYPSDLSQPDYVFVQDARSEMVILVWLDPENPEYVRMSLHFIPSGSWAIKKFEPVVVEETSVNGHDAVWTTGPYPMIMQGGDVDLIRLVEGHVLIWAEGAVTYRLETNLSLEEALRIAELLQPIP